MHGDAVCVMARDMLSIAADGCARPLGYGSSFGTVLIVTIYCVPSLTSTPVGGAMWRRMHVGGTVGPLHGLVAVIGASRRDARGRNVESIPVERIPLNSERLYLYCGVCGRVSELPTSPL